MQSPFPGCRWDRLVKNRHGWFWEISPPKNNIGEYSMEFKQFGRGCEQVAALIVGKPDECDQAERYRCAGLCWFTKESDNVDLCSLSVQAWYGWHKSWPCVFRLFRFFYFALFSLFSLEGRQPANHWHIGGEYFQPIKSLINQKHFVAIHITTLHFPIYWIFITTFIVPFGSWLGWYVLFRLCLST